MLKLVTIDCWGTILEDSSEWDVSLGVLAHEALSRQDPSCRQARSIAAFNQEASQFSERLALEHITVPPAVRLRTLCTIADIQLSDLALDQLLREFEAAIFNPPPKLVKGVAEFLRSVKGCDLKVGLVCNTGWFTSRAITNMLDYYQLSPLIDFAVYSDQVGHAKPDSRVFELTTKSSRCSPRETIHIGDNLSKDVEGALRAGEYAIHLHHNGRCNEQGFWCAADYRQVWAILVKHFGVSGPRGQ